MNDAIVSQTNYLHPKYRTKASLKYQGGEVDKKVESN